MKKLLPALLLLCAYTGFSQIKRDSIQPLVIHQYDTVVITALGAQPYKNIPYNIVALNLAALRKTPHTQLMAQLVQLPSVSSISAGGAINKPVIRGLSFNHVQLFAQGVRIDNQTWDDRHDIGVPDNGFDKVEIVNGPAALLYGPNTMGGAIILTETIPGVDEKPNGFAQLGFFGNSLGGDLKAGLRGSKKEFFYTANASYQMHANYVQGGGEEKTGTGTDDKPLAGNSKFTNLAVKGTIGVRKEKRTHQLTYSLYHQLLGIIEDESKENGGAVAKPEKERDYEMEAPYQDVTTHIISTQNRFESGANAFVVNAGYQYNARREFEPGTLPKSKTLGVGLNLQTLTADLQWLVNKNKNAGFTVGVQGFYQDNRNVGNTVLVPDAHIGTAGAYVISHVNTGKFSILAGIRLDAHQLNMFNTAGSLDTFNPAIPRPRQDLKKNYTPFSANAGLVYHASTALSIKANIATGYTAPNYAQLAAFGKHEGTYRFEVGDNNLSMEKNAEVDATIQYDKPDISISVNGYINHINNYIYINPTADSVKGLRIYRWVQHDADIHGLELDVQLHPAAARWFEAYVRAGLVRGKLTNGNGDLPYIPAFKIIPALTFKKESMGKWLQSYITLQTSIYGRQNKVAQFETETGGYVLEDIFIGTTAPFGNNHRWNLVAFCTNLLNKGYYNHLSLVKTIGIREPGRNIGLQVRYDF